MLARRLLPLIPLVLVAALVPAAGSAGAALVHALIQGSGSTWAANAVNQWVADVQPAPKSLQVVYTASGSAQGRKDFADGTVDYAVSDLPFLGTDPITGITDDSNGRTYSYVPMVGGGLALTYQLSVQGHLLTGLRLSASTLLGIFTGTIRYWDDPALVADNGPTLALPHLAITPVVRGDGSADSYVLSGYLGHRSPSQWQAFAGAAGPSPYFPAAADAVTQHGPSAVMNYVASSAGNGSIGYVQNSYAFARNYPVASVENAAHDFVPPAAHAVAVALEAATTTSDPTAASDFTPAYDSTDARAYPLSTYAYAIVPTGAADAHETTARRQTLVDFFAYALCAGQASLATYGYAPLPRSTVATAYGRLAALHAADPNVDVSGLDASQCPDEPAAVDPTQLSASRGQTIRFGATARLATVLTDTPINAVLAGRPVQLQARPAGATAWRVERSGTTNRFGALAIRVSPHITTAYRFGYPGDAHHHRASSSVTTVRVARAVTIHATHRVANHVVVWGSVQPGRAGGQVLLQQRVGSRWPTVGRLVLRRQLMPNGQRLLGFHVRLTAHGSGARRLRAWAPATATNVGAASVSIRVLR